MSRIMWKYQKIIIVCASFAVGTVSATSLFLKKNKNIFMLEVGFRFIHKKDNFMGNAFVFCESHRINVEIEFLILSIRTQKKLLIFVYMTRMRQWELMDFFGHVTILDVWTSMHFTTSVLRQWSYWKKRCYRSRSSFTFWLHQNWMWNGMQKEENESKNK